MGIAVPPVLPVSKIFSIGNQGVKNMKCKLCKKYVKKNERAYFRKKLLHSKCHTRCRWASRLDEKPKWFVEIFGE